jgi:hypothetical protein
MGRDWEKTLPKELQDYIEAERQSARASAIVEMRLGQLKLNDPLLPEVTVNKAEAKTVNDSVPAASRDSRRMRPGDRQLPRGLGAKMVQEAVQAIQPNTIVTVTDIRRRVRESTEGAFISFQTVSRAMEKLVENKELERIEGTDGWRVLARLRSIK